MTLAPLVVKDKVIVGVAGGEFGIRGFIAAYDAKTGKEAWRFYTIPGPGEPGHETWRRGDSWKHGGGSVWTTGTYDPELNLTYWGIGNPGPDFNAAQRPGDNLYSDSVVALDADTGKLKWHFQFTPNDPYDYDSTQVPVLVDGNVEGHAAQADVLRRIATASSTCSIARPASSCRASRTSNVNWATRPRRKGAADPDAAAAGRSRRIPDRSARPTGTRRRTARNTGLFYLSAWENYGQVFDPGDPIEFREGQNFTGGRLALPPGAPAMPGMQRGPGQHVARGRTRTAWSWRSIRRPATRKWGYEMHDVTTSGVLTTASDLLFVGGREGYFHALDARTGIAALEAERRRRDRRRSDDVHGRRQAACRGRGRPLAVRIRTAVIMSIMRATFSAAAIVLMASPLWAQAPAATAATATKLDTPQARVYVATLQPHTPARATSGHATNRVLVYLDDGVMTREETGGTKQTIEFKRGDVRWRPASGAYVAENTSARPIRILEIDLKAPPSGKVVFPKLDPPVVDAKHYSVMLDNEFVRVLRVQYGPREDGALHEHLLNRVVVYLNDQPNAKADDVRMSGPATHTEKNASDQVANRIAVEIK